MSKRTRFTQAILLRATDYRDADRICTLLTEDAGRISALARGARRSQKRFGGALQPYSLLRVEIGESRGSLDRLAQASVVRPYTGILTNLRKMALAGSAMEVIRRATPENEADVRAFETALEFLAALDGAESVAPSQLQAFTLRFLAITGLAPELRGCCGCGKPCREGQAGLFDATRGGLVCRACGGGAVHVSGAVRAAALNSLEKRWWPESPWPEEVSARIAQIMHQFVAVHLGKPFEQHDFAARVESEVHRVQGQAHRGDSAS